MDYTTQLEENAHPIPSQCEDQLTQGSFLKFR
jgi:hypothetical protein